MKGAHTDILVMLPCSGCAILSWANPFSRKVLVKFASIMTVLHTQQLASIIGISMVNLPLDLQSVQIKKMPMVDFFV